MCQKMGELVARGGRATLNGCSTGLYYIGMFFFHSFTTLIVVSDSLGSPCFVVDSSCAIMHHDAPVYGRGPGHKLLDMALHGAEHEFHDFQDMPVALVPSVFRLPPQLNV
jgi:hypothetical protein